MFRLPRLTVILILLSFGNYSVADDRVDFFETRIRPLLSEHCLDCHNADEANGKLRLDSKVGWVVGGERGPAIVPGEPAASLLYRAVRHANRDLRMPPPDVGEALSESQIKDIAAWIRAGAVDPRDGTVVRPIHAAAKDHWAFQPIRKPAITETGKNPVDYFVDRLLVERNLKATKQADYRTLARRATFDLHGLPPSPEQTALANDCYEKLVDELLASPRYGERWARHWLDVARYSDAKDGVLMYGDARIRPFAYTYRDYVIRAFNDDKPFDEFVRQQIAADQLPLAPNSPDLAALGLLTLGRLFDRNPHDVIDDQIDVVTRGFLGLTASCARCHDHKFDPIPTADYYSLYGVFASTMEPLDRPRIGEVTPEGRAYEDQITAKLDEIYSVRDRHYNEVLNQARERTADYLVTVATTEPDFAETAIFFLSLIPDQLHPRTIHRWRELIARRAHAHDPLFAPWHDLMEDPSDLNVERWQSRGVDPRIIAAILSAKPKTPKGIAEVYGKVIRDVGGRDNDLGDPIAELLLSEESPVWFHKSSVANYLDRQKADAFRGLLGQIDSIGVAHKNAAARAMVVTDHELLVDPVIFQRGDPSQRGNPVPRQFLSVLSDEQRAAFKNGSGRLELANAIASPANPLTARVWVNRVWMHHFGQPLVEHPSDFGLRTKRPVHHALLDYLAAVFIDEGWRTKPIHRLIMSSETYARSSRIDGNGQLKEQLEIDPNNKLYWRANRRRLDLEQMRDSMLLVSGQLDDSMYGRPLLITDPENRRRTIYAFVERQNIPAVVQSFDVANADSSTAKRVNTTVPQQALFAMNSEFVSRTAKAVVAQVAADVPIESRIATIYEIVLGRRPSDQELELSVAYLRQNTWNEFAHVLLMTNEFLFVD